VSDKIKKALKPLPEWKQQGKKQRLQGERLSRMVEGLRKAAIHIEHRQRRQARDVVDEIFEELWGAARPIAGLTLIDAGVESSLAAHLSRELDVTTLRDLANQTPETLLRECTALEILHGFLGIAKRLIHMEEERDS
jgi:hypothetical protein